jgi:hypothetical protein
MSGLLQNPYTAFSPRNSYEDTYRGEAVCLQNVWFGICAKKQHEITYPEKTSGFGLVPKANLSMNLCPNYMYQFESLHYFRSICFSNKIQHFREFLPKKNTSWSLYIFIVWWCWTKFYWPLPLSDLLQNQVKAFTPRNSYEDSYRGKAVCLQNVWLKIC